MTLETGLSDFHKMTLTVMKVSYKKQKPTIITCGSYKNFSNEVFISDVQNRISQGPLKTTTLNLTFSKQYLMKLFKNTLQ